MLKISEAEYERIKTASKANQNKRVAKRLEVLELRYARKNNAEIAEKTGFNKLYVTTLIQIYRKKKQRCLRSAKKKRKRERY